MEICFTINGIRHCYVLPELVVPIVPYRPGPGPVNYPELLRDATLLVSLRVAVNQVSDAKVRSALHSGMNEAMEALQARGGDHVSFEEIKQGGPVAAR